MEEILLEPAGFLQQLKIKRHTTMKSITQTAFSFNRQTGKYEGKVRDVYKPRPIPW